MKVVVAFTCDDNAPSGGAKQLYRHVDILNENGIEAVVAHPTRGFRLTWFKNDTRVVCSEDVRMEPGDFLLFGEAVGEVPRLRGSERCANVIYVQNPYNMMLGFGKNLGRIREVYGSAAGVLCQSAYTEENVRYFLPSANVMSFRYSFDRLPFAWCGDKRKVAAYMPRKHGGTASSVFALMSMRRCPDEWEVASLEGRNEERVAEVLKMAAVFVSFSMNEGFGMPPAEAMSCGCAVVGFPGFAGEEYMKPGLCWPVREYDVLEMVRAVETAMMTPVPELVKVGKKASDFIRSEYSSEKEVAGVMAAWHKMIKSSVQLTTPMERVRSEVAAYVPVYNEGPYLEALLRWLVRRVGVVFVCESERSWCPTAEPGGKSKCVVEKVLASMPEARGVLRYVLVKEDGSQETEPLRREAEQRNRTLEEIRRQGFKHVWMVEADEFYTDAEAERLWRWYFDREDDVRVVRASWHTYWRSLRWRIEPQEMFKPNIIFASDCKFEVGRKMSEKDEANAAEVPQSVCVVRHYSWSRTPSDTRRKLSAWGHAMQLRKGWFDEVFMAWKPGCNMGNLHPIEPGQYERVVRCEMPLPEALRKHPFADLDIIEEESQEVVAAVPMEQTKVVVNSNQTMKRVKAVIMSHNQPETVDELYEALAPVFDDVEVFDSMSDPNKVPVHVSRSFPNIYWTGLWNEVLRTCSDYDAVWVLGGDVKLRNDPVDYRRAIEESLPFGLWSPAVDGRSCMYMQPGNFKGKARMVWNIEGIAMAASGEMLRGMGMLPEDNKFGYGQDLWMSWKARTMALRNVIDGRVIITHPVGTGYSNDDAGRQMDETYGRMLGPNYRRSHFHFSDLFEENVVDWPKEEGVSEKITVVTVDNGWGIPDFVRLVGKVEGIRAVVMKKGVMTDCGSDGVECVPYDASLASLLKEADMALFTRVGDANKEDYLKLLKAGVPMVVHNACAQGMVEHQKNGYLYIEDGWALKWIAMLRDSVEERKRLEGVWGRDRNLHPIEPVKAFLPSKRDSFGAQPMVELVERPKVTVITPTYKRDPKVVLRCVNCMRLQTVQSWEQLVCSDGSEEPETRAAVESIGDPRVRYTFTHSKKEGDYGNTVRLAMLGQARGDYVLFCDDDNIIMPDYFDRMISVLEANPQAGFAVCHVMHFGPLNEKVAGKPPKVLTGEPVQLYHVDPLQVLVRREVMIKVGWDTKVGYLSDGVTLEALGKATPHVRVNEVLGVHV